MKRIPLFYLGLLFVINLPAQNLVPNGGFEEYSTCPTGAQQINYCNFWYTPNDGDPDFFHSCNNSINGNVGIPLSNYGYQNYNFSDGFTALHLFIIGWNDYREYLQTQLKQPLLTGEKYCISFFINLYNFDWNNNDILAIDNIGLYLSSSPISVTSPQFVLSGYLPQVFSGFITDTTQWSRVSGIYFATGGESFITIGNFNADSATTFLVVADNSGSVGDAYYLFDDVSVTKCRPPVLGNDITISSGSSVMIGDTAQDVANYFWSPSVGLQCDSCWQTWASPDTTTTYTLTKITPCDTTYDSIQVNVFVGVDELTMENFTAEVYPNPGSGVFTFSYSSPIENGLVIVCDLAGRKIISEKLNLRSSNLKIDLSGMQQGIYLYRFLSDEKLIATGKIEVLR